MNAARTISRDDLCDPAFLAALQNLQLVARRVAPRGRFAEQRSRAIGGGIEFKDFRPYAPGDDLRGVDWNIYRRLGRVFLRLFEETEDLPLYLLPDVSESAWFETPPRALAGLRCALGLASVSLGQHDRVGVFPFADDLATLIRPQAGKGRILDIARRVAEVKPGGATDLPKALDRFAALGLREGLVCVISDFFDPQGIDAIVESLMRVRHRLLLVQLFRKSDAEPVAGGDVRMVDCESGAIVDVSVTPTVVERYRAAVARFQEKLVTFSRARGVGLLRLDVEVDVLHQLSVLFESGRLVV